METKSRIDFADMPTHIRLMVVALVLVGISEFLRAFILSILASHGAASAPFSMALSGALVFGTTRALKRKNSKAPHRAVTILAACVVNNGYAMYAMSSMFDSLPWVSLWWPATHVAIYLGFVAVLLRPATSLFYKDEN